MPTWEGIEDASAVASRVWLARETDSDPWKPLRKCDCQALNAASVELNASANNNDQSSIVYIEGGRAAADLNEMTVSYNFFRGCTRQLTSATWFVKEEKSSKDIVLLPVDCAADSDAMEGLYQKAVAASSSLGKGVSSVLSDEVILSSDESKIKILKVAGSLSMKKIPKGWFASQYDLQRGYGEYTVDGEENELALSPVKHLVFVIHGIGEALFSREEIKVSSLIDQMNATRIAIQAKQVEDWKLRCKEAAKAGNPEPPPPCRIELLPVEWFSRLHDSSSSLMRSLRSTTLSTIPALRAIANDVVFDVLMYLTPAFCEAVLECVTAQINEIYQKYQQIHPDFVSSGGQCSLVGHSLGSVIVWDLLAILKDKTETAEAGSSSFDPCGVSIARQDSVEVGYQAYARKELTNKVRSGTWGPSLTKCMDQTIPFQPNCTIFLGSPLGIFLTLRGAHPVFDEMRKLAVEEARVSASAGKNSLEEVVEVPVSSPFSLPTAALYNIFHPSDPVAYRIEPLLMSQEMDPDDLPPPMYLTAPGKEVRLHLKAKQIGDEIRKSIMDQKNSWNALVSSALSAVTEPETATKQFGSGCAAQELKAGPPVFPLGGKSTRVDFSFQPGVIDNEYISAVSAHSGYFANADFRDFLISVMAASESAT